MTSYPNHTRDLARTLANTPMRPATVDVNEPHLKRALEQIGRAIDPRDPDPSREGIFRNHNCWKCQDGAKPCVRGATNRCEFPHARND